MDPITTTIVATLAAGAMAGLAEVSKKAIIDAYEGLKTVITTKFGPQSKLAEAITSLEGTPDSEGRLKTLQEEVGKAQADQDAEILAAVKVLKERLDEVAHGDKRIQRMLRSEGAQQTMHGQGGQQIQDMKDSPNASQTMKK